MSLASHKDKEWEWRGEKFKIVPGQFVTSLKSLVKLSGASTRQCRTAIDRFIKYEFLTNESTNTGRLITIVNWHIYQQEAREGDKQTGRQVTSNRQAGDTYQKCKNDKNDKNKDEDIQTPSDFDLFWQEYPRKVGKQDCIKIWRHPKKRKLRPPIEDIIDALTVQKISDDWTKEEGRYIPNPSTWLNQGRWDDELRMPSETKAKDLQPKTYAQAQDAERRLAARWLLKEMKNDKQKNSGEGTVEDVPQLLHDPQDG